MAGRRRPALLLLLGLVLAAAAAEEIFLTQKAIEYVEEAQAMAQSKRHTRLEPIHVAAALFADRSGFASRVVQKAGFDAALLATQLRAELRKMAPRVKHAVPAAEGEAESNVVPHSRNLENMYRRAIDEKAAHGDSSADGGKVTVAHLLCVCIDDATVRAALAKAAVAPEAVQAAARAAAAEAYGGREEEAAETFEALSLYAVDLVDKAERGLIDPVIGRDDEIRRCVQVLARRKKNNPVLTGPPGVGKTAVVEGLALRIVEGDVPDNLRHARIYALDLGLLMAGTGARGAFEARLSGVIRELQDSGGRAIVFIDEIHTLIGAGGGTLDAANMLKPALARGELRCIGATTDSEYVRYVEQDAAFERRLQRISVPEPTPSETVSILRGLRDKYEAHHGVRILDEALVAAAHLSDRYISGRFNPDKAIDLIDEACARRRVELDSRPADVDALERRVNELAGEMEALERETKLHSAGFLAAVFSSSKSVRARALDKRVSQLRAAHKTASESRAVARDAWKKQKQHYDDLRAVNQDIDQVETDIAALNRKGKHADAAELKQTLASLAKRRAEALQLAEEQTATKSKEEQFWGVTDVVSRGDVASVVSQSTAIPVDKLTSDGADRLLGLSQRLAARVVGQRAATDAVADTVLRSRAGLQSKARPRGAFLFVGPTGVGKTELAKALALELLDDADAIVRLDMSEYAEKHAISRLVGAPPGYIGHDDGGQLTEAVRKKPYSVVLLDEAEKAHPDIFNTFLQVLDEGRLTDAKGRTVDFRHTYIILTSNSKDIKSFFKPEFMNRLDHVIQFSPLDLGSLSAIAKFHIAELALMVAEEHDVVLTVTDSAAQAIVSANADDIAEYGARPLRRYVEQRVATDLAHLVLSGDVQLKRSRKLTLDFFGPTGLHFRVDAPHPGSRRGDDEDDDADDEAPIRLNRRDL